MNIPATIPRLPAALCIAAGLSLLAACDADRPDAAPGSDSAGTANTLTLDDGATLVYETHGSGDTAVVMVHCWGCNRGNWREQVDAVTGAGYRVVTMDLPGHGEAGRQRDQWRVSDYAGDIRELSAHLGLERVILLGHSMGGPVSLMAAPRLDAEVAGIVCVDALHDADFQWPEEFSERMVEAIETDLGGTLDGFLSGLFPPDADADLVAWVRAQAMAADPEALAGVMADFATVDMPRLMEDAGVPIRCINATPGPDFAMGMTTRVDTNRKYADFDAVLMDGVGHYPQLEAPERFNRHLLAILESLASPGGD